MGSRRTELNIRRIRATLIHNRNSSNFLIGHMLRYSFELHYISSNSETWPWARGTDLPTLNNEGLAKMYKAIDLWLAGKPVDELLGVPGSTNS